MQLETLVKEVSVPVVQKPAEFDLHENAQYNKKLAYSGKVYTSNYK